MNRAGRGWLLEYLYIALIHKIINAIVAAPDGSEKLTINKITNYDDFVSDNTEIIYPLLGLSVDYLVANNEFISALSPDSEGINLYI